MVCHNCAPCCVQIFLEQKKMIKTGLAWFSQFIPIIEEETKEYFKRWGDSGEKGQFRRSFFTNKHALHSSVVQYQYRDIPRYIAVVPPDGALGNECAPHCPLL